ncbi:ABC transporter ATP-binding protein [Vaginisenegalia massiliensis]|uniref:ABC transporter ATP-binding protein n=1 Tax=Vaginisenegalia massiliensis TaxID=2058294 RepID=UPI000F52D965|nr:ABC transporter ATP-binding protein [Vaginisenegalia massiliensis]
MSLLKVKQLNKIYGGKIGQVKTQALNNLSLAIDEGEFVAIMGESGSGKSTLLNIIATLDQPTSGQIQFNGQDLAKIPQKDLAAFRRQQLGFVFQDFNVLDSFTNKDNILLPLVLSGTSVKQMESQLNKVASQVGVESLLEKYPYEISGGQKQRIAIARAIITNPKLLLADEPTGALDSKTAEQVMNLFTQINDAGNTLLMVTHSIRSASFAKRVSFIKDGRLFHEIYRGQLSQADFQEKISQAITMLNQRGDSFEA